MILLWLISSSLPYSLFLFHVPRIFSLNPSPSSYPACPLTGCSFIICMRVSAGVKGGQKGAANAQELGALVGCEPPNMDAGHRIGSFARGGCVLDCSDVSLAPTFKETSTVSPTMTLLVCMAPALNTSKFLVTAVLSGVRWHLHFRDIECFLKYLLVVCVSSSEHCLPFPLATG